MDLHDKLTPENFFQIIKTKYPSLHNEIIKRHRIIFRNFILALLPIIGLICAINFGTFLCAEYSIDKGTTITEYTKRNKNGDRVKYLNIIGGITKISGPDVDYDLELINYSKNFKVKSDIIYRSEKSENKIFIKTPIHHILRLFLWVFSILGSIILCVYIMCESHERFYPNGCMGMFLDYFESRNYFESRKEWDTYKISTLKYVIIMSKEFFGYRMSFQDVINIYNCNEFAEILNYNADGKIKGGYYRWDYIKPPKDSEIKYLSKYTDYIVKQRAFSERVGYFDILYFDCEKFNRENVINNKG